MVKKRKTLLGVKDKVECPSVFLKMFRFEKVFFSRKKKSSELTPILVQCHISIPLENVRKSMVF